MRTLWTVTTAIVGMLVAQQAYALTCDYQWTGTSTYLNCPASWEGTSDGCDCGCQWVDPDCGVCDYNWTGSSTEDACPSSWYGTNDGCDCGCQWIDPDCGYASTTTTTSSTGPLPSVSKVGAVGDSISAAFDVSDDCDTLVECAGQLGEDRAYSWTTGYSATYSIRNRLGAYSTNEAQVSGARWQDAPGQAQNIINNGGANVVTIELGGNDVCRGLYDTLPTQAEIGGYVDQTLTTLTNGLAAGSTIVLAEMPDIVHLRDTMRYQKNFAFETCQDLWDLDTTALDVNTCDGGWWLTELFCDLADLIIEAIGDFVTPLKNAIVAAFHVEFPCGYVLNSGSNDTKRALARQLNNEINSVLATKAAAYNGRNGVYVRFAPNVYEFQFTTGDVSQLDCFHPNRQGSANLANTIWNGASLGSLQPTVADTSAPYLTATPTHYWAESYTAIYSTFNTSENARLEIWVDVASCSTCTPFSSYLWGTTNETPTYHEFRLHNLNYANWYRLRVRAIDASGNYGSWYTSSFM